MGESFLLPFQIFHTKSVLRTKLTTLLGCCAVSLPLYIVVGWRLSVLSISGIRFHLHCVPSGFRFFQQGATDKDAFVKKKTTQIGV